MNNEIPWAFNTENKPVFAHKVNRSNGPFFCHCGMKHEMYLKQPSGREGIRYVTPHFAHWPNKQHDLLSVSNSMGSCHTKLGESDEHRYAKVLLKEYIGQYTFNYVECDVCHQPTVQFDPTACEVSIEVRHDPWRLDCCVTRNNTREVALEVYHTHRCTLGKIKDIQQNGLRIAEIRATDIIDLLSRETMSDDMIFLDNVLAQKETCVKCIQKQEEQTRLQRLKKEEEERARLQRLRREQEEHAKLQILRQQHSLQQFRREQEEHAKLQILRQQQEARRVEAEQIQKIRVEQAKAKKIDEQLLLKEQDRLVSLYWRSVSPEERADFLHQMYHIRTRYLTPT